MGACSLKSMAVNTVADTLSDTGTVFTRDADPELIKDAIPFALKFYESILESAPKHQGLLVATCQAFTSYGVMLQVDSDVIRKENYEAAETLNARALGLYLRGRDYCMRGFEVRLPGIAERLAADAPAALARATKDDLPLLYWTAASWGSAIALAPDRPDLLIDFPAVRALIDRALAVDEAWGGGAVHEALISIESLETFGGTPEKARAHFDRAVALQKGTSPGPYVALATGIYQGRSRGEFQKLLEQALAIDPEKNPDNRLVSLLAQRRAKSLLANVDSLFAD
jgi:predicted anti-sigma-YlaC factor YlaD